MVMTQKAYNEATQAEKQADDRRGSKAMANWEAADALKQARMNYAQTHGAVAEAGIRAQALSNYQEYQKRSQIVQSALKARGVVDDDIRRYAPGIASSMRIYMDRGKNPTEACMQAIKDSPLYAEGGPALARYNPKPAVNPAPTQVPAHSAPAAARPQMQSQSTTVLRVEVGESVYYVKSSQLNFDDPKAFKDNLAKALADPNAKVVSNAGHKVDPSRFRSEVAAAQSQQEFVGVGMANPPARLFR